MTPDVDNPLNFKVVSTSVKHQPIGDFIAVLSKDTMQKHHIREYDSIILKKKWSRP